MHVQKILIVYYLYIYIIYNVTQITYIYILNITFNHKFEIII